MNNPATSETVASLAARAQEGDLGAFERLVVRQQAVAQGYALARLGEREAARDAAQDAFIDAFLHLGALRDPAAFSGWLRRIVWKHCDRQIRRRREQAVHLEPQLGSSPVEALSRAEERSWLLGAIETLPEHERVVVALHYLADTPIAEIAEFLEVSLPAVKKRLFSARQRLKNGGPLMHAPITVTRASDFSDPIALFLAIRAGASDTVARVLARRPELVEAEERWSNDEALTGGFTLAHRLTPLVLAASLGDEAMVACLLAHGASVAGRCGCDNGETALYAAVRSGHRAIVRRLLEAGAKLEDPAGSKLTLLELASWRGDPELVALLRDPSAEEAALLPLPAPTSAVATPAPRAATGDRASPRLHTGIKALDLLVPLEAGAVVRVHGAAETGLMVLLAELAHAIGRRGGISVWTTWRRFDWQANEMASVAARHGVEAVTIVHDDARAPELLDRALAVATELGRRHPLVAHVVFEEEGHAAELEAASLRLSSAADLTFLVRPWASVTRGTFAAPSLDGPHHAVIATDPGLARRGLYPAIDPALSASLFLHERPELALAARQLLLRHRRPAEGTLAADEHARAERLEAFLSQPFHAATPDTGWPGTDVPVGEMLEGVAAILDGSLTLAPELLRYRGSLRELEGLASAARGFLEGN